MGCGRAGDGIGAGADALIVIYTVIMESCANGACLLLTYAVRPGTSAGMHARTRPARLRLVALAASALSEVRATGYPVRPLSSPFFVCRLSPLLKGLERSVLSRVTRTRRQSNGAAL